MRKIALVNHKGGVGKTTTAVNLGEALGLLNKKVLLIDIDPQAHLTYSLGIASHELEKTIYSLLQGIVNVEDCIIKKENVYVLPSSIDLSGADIEFASIPGREFILKDSLKSIDPFDFVIIDCPPSLGLLTLNALVFVNEIFIPLQTEFLSLQGMSKLLQAVDIVKSRLNESLEIAGIIGTRFDVRKKLNNEIIQKVGEYFGDKLFKTLIRDNVSIAEAPSFGQHIFAYKKDSHGALDYMSLAHEVIAMKI